MHIVEYLSALFFSGVSYITSALARCVENSTLVSSLLKTKVNFC
jgi:hypothetical protein